MTQRRRRLLAITALIALSACVVGWYAFMVYRETQFLHNLHLVFFSTSMIGPPRAEEEHAAHLRAEELNIDLFAAYQNNLETDARYSLAWMLMTKESPEYYELAKQNIDTVPWPEVRIWRVRRSEEALSPEYRKKLLDLVLSSPTSEAKLAAGHWYRKHGKITESDDAFHAAMTNGLFWDALDAADLLIESKRYHHDAVEHLFAVVRDDPDYFVERAAFSLLNLYGVRDELEPLVDLCRKENKAGPNRKVLVDKLAQLIEKDVRVSMP